MTTSSPGAGVVAEHGFGTMRGVTRTSVAVLLAVLAAVGIGPSAIAQEGPPPTPVRMDAVRQETMQARARVTGEVRARDRSLVAAEVEGRVLEVLVRAGTRVSAGEPLARLDAVRSALEVDRLEARITVAEAVVAVRQAELDRAALDLERLERLAEDRASRPRELDDARAAKTVAEGRLAEARADAVVVAAELAIATQERDDATIVAPFDGVVVARHVDPGRWVERGGAIAEVVGTRHFEIWLDVPQEQVPALVSGAGGLAATVAAADRAWPPATPILVPTVTPDARTLQVYLPVEEDSGSLVAGMSAVGYVPLARETEVLTVHRDALLRNEAGSYVYVARSMGEGPMMAQPVKIRVRFDAGVRVVVDGDLRADELVVVEGNERLFPMTPVVPIADGAPPSDSATSRDAAEGAGSP